VTTQISLSTTPLNFQTWNWQGYNICYTVVGTGKPLVLIHGFGASIRHWRRNIFVLAEAGYQVFVIDLLGFGRSDKPAIEYQMEVWQDLLQDFWTAHIQEPAVFVGNSIGALLSLMILANHPEIASGGVLLNAAGGLNHRPEELNPPLRMMMGTFTKVITAPVLGEFLFNQIRKKPRLRRTLQQVYHDRTAVTDELIELIHEPACEPGAQKVFASILTAPPGPRPQELLPRVTQPMLVLWGEADPWTPISGSKIYQDLVIQAPDRVKFVSIPNTGHCPHDERPEIVNAEILQWLSESFGT